MMDIVGMLRSTSNWITVVHDMPTADAQHCFENFDWDGVQIMGGVRVDTRLFFAFTLKNKGA